MPNAYFPLFIPESYLKREAAHVEGFSPELAVVTIGGGKELDEPVVVRPTSETIINAYFSKWIQSYRDLPVPDQPVGQRGPVGAAPAAVPAHHGIPVAGGPHRARHRGASPGLRVRILHDVYEDFMVNVLAIPVLTGRKTERERFSGATTTWTCEAMMRDGKALQMGTSHELGQNFARVFDTTFLDESGHEEHVWQTSWGASSRLMGALVMAHGDDAGLRIPPLLAPVQVVVLVVRDEEGAGDKAAAIAAQLSAAGLRTQLDARTDTSFGRRVVDWELKGVPVRVEVGPRELDAGEAVLVRRDSGTKTTVPLAGLDATVRAALDEAQMALLADALERRRAATVEVATMAEAERRPAPDSPWCRCGPSGPRARRRSTRPA